MKFKHVCLESLKLHLPETEVSSAELEDRLAPLYERLQIPFGTLEKLSGIKARRMWPIKTMPSDMATIAAQGVLEELAFPREQITALINTSVTRDFLEPATSCLVHRKLGFSEGTMALDISNACIGFSNGMMYVAHLIESGAIRAGLIVSAESVGPIIESTIQHLLHQTTIGRDELLKILPTFTLGCGAVAAVLCHESISKHGHKIHGSISSSATEYNDLCLGNVDCCSSGESAAEVLMHTESGKLMAAAAKLGGRVFREFSQKFGWTRADIQHIFCHQVGKQVNEGFYAELGLDIEKEFTVYKNLGNLVSAAVPAALAVGSEAKGLKSGERVLLMGFGSGLNAIFTGVTW